MTANDHLSPGQFGSRTADGGATTTNGQGGPTGVPSTNTTTTVTGSAPVISSRTT